MPSQSRYTWSPRSFRYRERQSGRFVPQTAVFREVERFMSAGGHRMRSFAVELLAGRIKPAEFRERMRRELRVQHAVSSASAAGGWQQMTPADWGRVKLEAPEGVH